MAQNITLMGASYSDVPSVTLPKTGGGTASFTDVTDTTATASDVASGKYFYLASGEKVQGSASGGSGDGYVWQDAQGYVHLSDEEGTHVTVDSLTVSSSGTQTAPTGHAYSPVIVPAGTAGTPTATKGTVSNHSITVTPSVTNTAGWISSGTTNGTAVTVTASELVSGSQNITSNGNNIDVTNLASVNVNVSGGGGTTTLKMGVLRPDAELVQSWTYDKYIVEDEELTIPTYTTSATNIKGSETITTGNVLDIDTYDYMLIGRNLVTPSYSISTKGAGRQIYHFKIWTAEIITFPADAISDGGISPTQNYTYIRETNQPDLFYYTGASSVALAGVDYGAYCRYASVPSINGNDVTGLYTFNGYTPALSIRGSTTYFTQTYMNALEDIRYQYIIELYRAKKGDLNIDGFGIQSLANHIIGCINSTGTLT